MNFVSLVVWRNEGKNRKVWQCFSWNKSQSYDEWATHCIVFFFLFSNSKCNNDDVDVKQQLPKTKIRKDKKEKLFSKGKRINTTNKARRSCDTLHIQYTEKWKCWTTRFSLNFLSVTRLFKITFVCCLYIWYAMHIAQQNLHFECWITYTHLTKR